jgi:hypothetical protein
MASGGQISYDEALATLTSMFPRVDTAVVEAVLELNRACTRRGCLALAAARAHADARRHAPPSPLAGGAMEPTVEQLLGLDPDNQAR